jgi:hypothetical protein
LTAGSRAPFFSLVAVGSGRRVSLREVSGKRLVLVFHGRGDEGAVREINRTVREKFPSPEDPLVASVIDLSFVPPFYWVAANIELDRAYREAARELPPEADPKQYVVILPDWTGSATRKFRGANRDSVEIVVIGGDSTVLGTAKDAEGLVETLEKLR